LATCWPARALVDVEAMGLVGWECLIAARIRPWPAFYAAALAVPKPWPGLMAVAAGVLLPSMLRRGMGMNGSAVVPSLNKVARPLSKPGLDLLGSAIQRLLQKRPWTCSLRSARGSLVNVPSRPLLGCRSIIRAQAYRTSEIANRRCSELAQKQSAPSRSPLEACSNEASSSCCGAAQGPASASKRYSDRVGLRRSRASIRASGSLGHADGLAGISSRSTVGEQERPLRSW